MEMKNEAVDEMLDLRECFRPVAKARGREMLELVMQAGLGREAAERLGKGLAGQPQALEAVRTLAQAFNVLSSAYAKAMRWSVEDLAACEREIQQAYAGQLRGEDGAPLRKH